VKKIIFTLLVFHCFPIRRLIGISILSTLLITNCYGQWVQSIIPNGGVVRSLTANGNNIFAGTGIGVFLSTNNGNDWTQTTMNHIPVFSLASDGNNIFAGTFANGFYLSTNNGLSWTQTGLNSSVVYSLAVSGGRIFAGTNSNGVNLSTNNGLNWTQTDLNNTVVFSLAANGSNIFAGTVNGIYLSTNSGTNWIQTVLNYPWVLSLAVSGSNIFAGTSDYGVWNSSNLGTNWTQSGLNNTNIDIPSVAIYGNNIFAGTDSGVYLSKISEFNWIQINQGFNVTPSIISLLISNNYIFAGTVGQYVWRRNLSEIVGIQNISTETPPGFSLSQNYPNPFNPVTKIKFTVANGFPIKTFGNDKGEVLVTLKVFDVLGREVETLVNEQFAPGTYSIDWNASQFSSGVYFYQLRVGTYLETKKMLLIK